MLMQDGFSYTKSELQEGGELEKSSSSSTGSGSDSLYSEVIEKGQIQAQKGIKTVENRMKFFNRHLKLVRIEQGRVVDPFRQHLMNMLGPEFKSLKMDWSAQSIVKPATSAQSQSLTGRRSSTFAPPRSHQSPSKAFSISGSVRSVSADEFAFALEKALLTKSSEVVDKRLKQFHRLRMKKMLTIDKLTEYLEMLETKQQQRLIEEHAGSFRQFKYAGPSREGPLFCLREKYRRERKDWRVKYAKRYGLLCRQVRLEKRLMRKAKRLLTRERILNALKDKTRSKLIVLLEMRHEFKKLVEKLKLNKEIQEKIKRQDRSNKNSDRNKAVQRSSKFKVVDEEKAKSRRLFSSGVPNIETGELQKSTKSKFKVLGNHVSLSEVSTLTPLPSVPSTSIPSRGTLPSIKNPNKPNARIVAKTPHLPKIDGPKKDTRCPPLTRDKNLGAAKKLAERSTISTTTFSGATAKFETVTGTKAKIARSSHWELPLINEMKYGALPVRNDGLESELTSEDEGKNNMKSSCTPTEKDTIKTLKKERKEIETLLQTGKKNADQGTKLRGGIQSFAKDRRVKSMESRPLSKRNSIQREELHKVQMDSMMSSAFSGQIISQRALPVGLVRSSDVNRVPRYKYKERESKWYSNLFSSVCRKLLDEDLKSVFGNQRSENFMNNVLNDIQRTSEFIFDNLHLLPRTEVVNIVRNMVNFRGDSRFPLFKRMCLNYIATVDSGHYKTARHKLKDASGIMFETLKESYKKFEEKQIQKKKEYRADRSKKGRIKKTADESKSISKKRKRRLLSDKMLLQRGHQFRNPVRVTTKLGGKLMLQGWKTLTFEEYINLGSKLEIYKSGWRKDGMEHYEIITPHVPVDNLKYLLVLNRLDLTPRRFVFPGYKYNGHILHLLKYCSTFYRSCLLKKGDLKTDRSKQRSSFQDNHGRARAFFGSTLLEGEFRVPHLRHIIFTTSTNQVEPYKPKDRNTPLVFSKRNEFVDDDEDPKKLKILLQETETLELWSYESTVALNGTEDAVQYGKDLRRMRKYLSRFHRTFERDTQTELVNTIDRNTQTDDLYRDSKKTNVYETEIMRAGTDLPPPKIKLMKRPGFQNDDDSDPSTECSASSIESFPDVNSRILTKSEFTSKVKLTLRIMDSMIYSDKQLTFRQGRQTDPNDPKARVTYSHERLFSFIDKRIALSEYVVTCMDWSSVNPNLLAVGYARHPLYPEQDKGMICIWNVKMVTKYERKFEFKNGVTYLQFCAPYPRLLNVALLDGSVLILDLGAKRQIVVTTKLSSVFSDYKPIWQFSWIEVEKGNFVPVTCGDNGFIHQLRPDGTFQHSKFLSLGHREGQVKGINLSSSMGLKPRIRGRPGITCLEKHPTDPVLYLVGTTDGCVHICSVYFRNQHLDVFSAHIGAVKGIQFHPHCEHVFLTYGEDFYVRVWLYGTFEPALELMADNYYVRAARWSPVNPEILVSVSNKYVDVWDIRRKTDSPMHRFMNPKELENTALIFDGTGRNIVLGNICGDVYVYALKNMPFVHHFKGEAIASALEKVLKAKKKFVRDIRKLGYPFGATKDQTI